MEKFKIPKELERHDSFYIMYCGSFERFHIVKRFPEYVIAHPFKCCKSDSIPLTLDELIEKGYKYGGRISKIRAFFLL